MTVGIPSRAHRWIQEARPEAPAALTQRVMDLLQAHPEWDALPVADVLANAGQSLLHGVLARSGAGAGDRTNAVDLLAADACVTWAFEAVGDPDSVPERAQAMMSRISMSVVSGHPL